MIWAVLKLLLKILSLAMSIPEMNRVRWINDCENTFDELKKATTSEQRTKVASDLANLIKRM